MHAHTGHGMREPLVQVPLAGVVGRFGGVESSPAHVAVVVVCCVVVVVGLGGWVGEWGLNTRTLSPAPAVHAVCSLRRLRGGPGACTFGG